MNKVTVYAIVTEDGKISKPYRKISELKRDLKERREAGETGLSMTTRTFRKLS